MHVSELWIYPIKSCRGIAVEQLPLNDRGPVDDRRWMLVDTAGKFISQRDAPRLALIDVALENGHVRLHAPGTRELRFQDDAATGLAACTIWRDTVELEHVSREADMWFSDFLAVNCRLMRMPARTERVVDPHFAPQRRLVSLADAFPLLLIGTGSLALLNEKLVSHGQPPVPMKRFRPNVVVAETEPHEEDSWSKLRIGDLECAVVKPCARCAIPTVDVETGVAGVEPLRTLASYRKQGSKVYFGQNMIHLQRGVIRAGDEVLPLW